MSDTMPSDKAPESEGDRNQARNARILRWLIQATSLAALRGEAAAMARAARDRAIVKAIEMIFWLIVFGFAIGALVTWLASAVGGIWACAIVAGSAAIVALILHLIEAQMQKHRPSLHLASAFPPLAAAMKDGTVDGTALGAIALAALAGIFLGTRSKPH